MAESKLIGLTNQSFKDAGGSKEFPNLEMDAPISANETLVAEERIMSLLNARLRTAAHSQGDTYVFGIEYTFENLKYDLAGQRAFSGSAIGTGYKPKAK